MNEPLKLKNECYTPAYFIDPIREFARGFDFDPFSCDLANETVKARNYCSYTDCAYDYLNEGMWAQCVKFWINPPYSTKELKQAISMLLAWKENKEIYLLLNTDNSTAAYKQCLRHCTALMLVHDRIKFVRPYADSTKDQNNRAQTLFFFGTIDRAKEFKQELSHLGKIFVND